MSNTIFKSLLIFVFCLVSCSTSDSEEENLIPILEVPKTLSATTISTTEINLTWSYDGNNADGFKLERKTGSEEFAKITSISGVTTTTYSDTGLQSATQYTYRIRAYNTQSLSLFSNEISAQTEAVVQQTSKTYYIDATNGNDANNGNSENTSWKTLSKVNETTFNPDDKILFKSGEVWNGQLLLKGSGSEGKPIIVNSYGSGNKPIFNGGGVTENDGTTLRLKNGSYWEINNLEITNTDGSTAQQGPIWGLRSIVDNGTEVKRLY